MSLPSNTDLSSLRREFRREGAAPLYHHVERALRQHISAGRMSAGDLAPTEVELQELFDVSRSTVRRAIDNLVADGILEKRQGVGTFVATPPTTYECRSSFTVDALQAGRTPGTRVLDLRTIRAEDPAKSELDVADGDPLVKVRRLRLLDERPVFVADAFLPARLVPGLSPERIPTAGAKQSLYYILEHDYGIALGDGSEETTAVSAPTDVSRLLDLEPNTPVVKTRCLLRDGDGHAVIYEEALWGVTQNIQLKWQSTLTAGDAQ